MSTPAKAEWPNTKNSTEEDSMIGATMIDSTDTTDEGSTIDLLIVKKNYPQMCISRIKIRPFLETTLTVEEMAIETACLMIAYH